MSADTYGARYYTNTLTQCSQWEFPTRRANDLPPGATPLARRVGAPQVTDEFAVLAMPATLAPQATEAPRSRGVAQSSRNSAVAIKLNPLAQQQTGWLDVAPRGSAAGAVPRYVVVKQGTITVLSSPTASPEEAEASMCLADAGGSGVKLLAPERSAGRDFGIEIAAGQQRIVLFAATAEERDGWFKVIFHVAKASRTWRGAGDLGDSFVKTATRAAGGGFGWTMGSNVASKLSRSIGL